MENSDIKGQNTVEMPVEALTPKRKAKALISKFDRWKKNKYIQEIVNTTKALVQQPIVAKLLNEILPDNEEVALRNEILENILRDKRINSGRAPFSNLLLNLHKLEHGCGMHLFVNKLDNGTLKLEERPITRGPLVYELKGSTLEDVSNKLWASVFIGPGQRRRRCPLNVIEILDMTKRDESLLYKILSTVQNEAYPTIIKYQHSGRRVKTRTLLVHLPPQLNASQLYTAYGEEITRIRDDFYAKGGEKGRPAGRHETEQRIRETMSELAASDRGFANKSMTKMYDKIAEKLDMNKDYLRSEYRPLIREEQNIYRSIRNIVGKMGVVALAKMPDNDVCSLFATKTGKSPSQFKSTYLPYVRLLRPKSSNN